MDFFDVIRARRSIRRFAAAPVDRHRIERLLDAAVLAPNHRLTEPWGFLVLGPESQRAYARVLGRRRSARAADPEAAAAVREKTDREISAVPVVIAVTSSLDENPEIREEDYAATYMAVQNLLLAATADGLGTHMKTGAVLDDLELRDALDVPADLRIVALVWLGEPEEVPPPRPRTPAAEKTRWLD